MTDHTEDQTNDGDLTTQPLHSASFLDNNSVLVNRFSIVKPLGSGAQGNVYHAYDQLLEVDVAIKVVETDLNDTSRLNTIRNEVLIARRLQHPNIIRVHDVFEDQGLVFFTMELVSSTPLIQRLDEPVSRHEFEHWTEQLFSALVACDSLDVKHGDIKPDNILIDDNNDLRLIDFGIGQQHSNQVQTSGHKDYSAPEVIHGGTSSVQSEIYSAGKVIQLMLHHVANKRLSLSDNLWHSKHARFCARLCHQSKSQRPTLTQAQQFYAGPVGRFSHGTVIAATFALVVIGGIIWFALLNKSTDDEQSLSSGTLQVAIVHDQRSDLLKGLVELLEMPLQTHPQLSLISSDSARTSINNLSLHPIENQTDRVQLASLLALDALIVFSVESIQQDDFLIRASVRSMPADISILELTRSINANNLSDDLSEFSQSLFVALNEHLALPFKDSEAPPFLPVLAALSPQSVTNGSVAQHAMAEHAPDYAGVWYRSALSAADNGDWQTALNHLDNLFQLDTSSPYWLLSGRLLQAELDGNLELALQSIDSLTENFPNRPNLLAKRAEIAEWANEIDRAMSDYQKAIELSPNNGHLWFQLARLKIISGKTQEAIDNELTRALVLFRDNKNLAGEGLTLNAFGVAYLRLAQYDTAEKYLKDALNIYDAANYPLERVKSLANLANVDALNGKFEMAKEALEEALLLLEKVGDTSQLAHVTDTLGFLHEEQGLYNEALGYYKRALDIRSVDSNDNAKAQSMSNVAYMHFLIGDYSLADIYWQQAKSLFSKSNEQLHLQRTLQNLAQLSLAKGDHLAASRLLTQVSQQIDASQKQEAMINQLLYSYLNFAKGELNSSLDNLSQARTLAAETNDNRALTEIHLWHAEVCLRSADLNCLGDNIEMAKNTISQAMIEQQALLGWLALSEKIESSEATGLESSEFVQQVVKASIPILTEMKILLDIQERLNLPLDSQAMQRLDDIVQPIFYAQNMQYLYIQRAEPEALKSLRAQVDSHPDHWRNHLYYGLYADQPAQQKQQQLLQDWMSQLSEQQALTYRERYIEPN